MSHATAGAAAPDLQVAVQKASSLPWRRARTVLRIRQPHVLAFFYRSLGLLCDAGIRLDRALDLLARQADDPALKAVLPRVQYSLVEGQSLSRALAAFPHIFPPMHSVLVEAGESTGQLPGALGQLATYEEQRGTMLYRVHNALTYPAILFVVSLVVMAVGPPYLVGGLLHFLHDMQADLPLPTRLLVDLSAVVESRYFVGGAAVLLYGGTVLYEHLSTHPEARRAWTARLLGWPVLGPTLRTLAVARFARSLALTQSAGISPLHGLSLAAQASDNAVLMKHIHVAIEGLQNGRPIHDCLADTEFFPKAFLQVLAVGDASHRIGDVARRMADLYEAEADDRLVRSLALLEPTWMVCMGVLAGFICVGTTLPIMSVLDHL